MRSLHLAALRAPLTFLALLLPLACTSAPPALPPGEAFGEPLVAQEQVVPLATVDANPSAYFERTVLVEATVEAVCKRAGCWMQIADEGRTAMVRWETGCGGKYVFPQEAVGRRVIVQGSFYPKTISPEDVEHLQEEAGEAIAIEAEGYEFNASAVLLIDPS